MARAAVARGSACHVCSPLMEFDRARIAGESLVDACLQTADRAVRDAGLSPRVSAVLGVSPDTSLSSFIARKEMWLPPRDR